MTGLDDLTVVQLLEEYNRLSAEGDKLTGWKKDKKTLAERVTKLRADRKPSARPIKSAAYSLLLEVSYREPGTDRAVGLDYDEILRRVRDEFPGCSTTDKCLRWYAVRLNEEGVKLPYRPRRSPRRAKPTEGR